MALEWVFGECVWRKADPGLALVGAPQLFQVIFIFGRDLVVGLCRMQDTSISQIVEVLVVREDYVSADVP